MSTPINSPRATERTHALPKALTVGELRAAIDGLDDDLAVVLEGGEWDHKPAHTVAVVPLDWHTDHDGEELDEDGFYTRDCLVIE